MRIAYTMAEGPGTLDRRLADLAEALAAAGKRLAGVVQINSDRPDAHRCDMDLRILGGGPEVRISQYLGREARGCRLDSGALENAVAMVLAGLEPGVDLLLINKFGRRECEGGGMRAAISRAIELDIPVLIGVNPASEGALCAYLGEGAVRIEADELATWVDHR